MPVFHVKREVAGDCGYVEYFVGKYPFHVELFGSTRIR